MGRESAGDAFIIFALAFVGMFLAGCVATQPLTQGTSAPQRNDTTSGECKDKACLIAAANACQNITIELTESIGVIKYSVAMANSTHCNFTKTLVQLDQNETQEMKTLLEGKSLVCVYEKGKFDDQLVNYIVFGIERCEGDLKDILGQLVLFS
jgi:hypothetical protein